MRLLTRLLMGGCLLASASAFALPTPVAEWQFNNSLAEANGGAAINLTANAAIGSKSSFTTDTINGVTAQTLAYSNYTNTDTLQVLAGLAANGGGARVNQYTVVMDVKVTAGSYNALLETAHGDSDAEVFFHNSSVGRSSSYYFRQSGVTELNTWMRFAVTVDMVNKVSRMYANGQLVGTFDSSHGNVSDGVDGRMALTAGSGSNFQLFGEDVYDGDTDGSAGQINSLAVWDAVLTADEVEQLGAASADGIPASVSARTETLAINKAMSSTAVSNYGNPGQDPVAYGDLSNAWAEQGQWYSSTGTYACYKGDGWLYMGHYAANWSHPWIEVNTSPTLGLTDNMEVVVDMKPIFNPTMSNEAVTMMISGAAPAAAAGHDGNYYSPDIVTRIGHAANTLAVQCATSASQLTAISGSVYNPAPATVSDVTASSNSLQNVQVVMAYHDGAYWAYYGLAGEKQLRAFPNMAAGAVKTRTKTVFRLTMESFYQASYLPWTLNIDQIRVYNGWSTTPVELSGFSLD